MNRAAALVRVFHRDRGRGQPSNDDRVLPAAALVFAMGALDAYLHDLILEVVPAFREHADGALKEALMALAKRDPTLMLRLARRDSHAAIRLLRDGLATTFEDASFYGPQGVERARNLLGCGSVWPDTDLVLGGKHGVTAELLGRARDTRHRLVHRSTYVKVLADDAWAAIGVADIVASAVEDKVRAHYVLAPVGAVAALPKRRPRGTNSS